MTKRAGPLSSFVIRASSFVLLLSLVLGHSSFLRPSPPPAARQFFWWPSNEKVRRRFDDQLWHGRPRRQAGDKQHRGRHVLRLQDDPPLLGRHRLGPHLQDRRLHF